MRAWLVSRYGDESSDDKFRRYMALAKPAISVVGEHTYLLKDICNSYVQGSLYSALTGACCIGERILNDIIFEVMDDFRESEHYKKVYNRGSIIDWGQAIRILSDWSILDTETAKKYKELHQLRIESVHFRKESQNLEKISLEAINNVNFVINKLFAVGPHRKDILLYFQAPGEIYIKKEVELVPMVKAFYIPCSILVGPRHTVESGAQAREFLIVDTEQYEDKEINDAEFVKLRKEFLQY
jgi:hypothetical protein